jgi:hypothetical protein
LVKELRLAGICTVEAANAWLPGFVEDYNRRFSRAPANAKDLHRRDKRLISDVLARKKVPRFASPPMPAAKQVLLNGVSSSATESNSQSQTTDLRCDERPEGAHFRRGRKDH